MQSMASGPQACLYFLKKWLGLCKEKQQQGRSGEQNLHIEISIRLFAFSRKRPIGQQLVNRKIISEALAEIRRRVGDNSFEMYVPSHCGALRSDSC